MMSMMMMMLMVVVSILFTILLSCHLTDALFSEIAKYVGTGSAGNANQGTAVAASPDGRTFVTVGPNDASTFPDGSAWVFTTTSFANPSTFAQATKILPTTCGAGDLTNYLPNVAVSNNASTVVVCGIVYNSYSGCCQTFARGVSSTWATTTTLNPTTSSSYFGSSVAITPSSSVVAVGAYGDNAFVGAVFIFTLTSSYAQSTKLVGAGTSGSVYQGFSVALSADGSVVAHGGYNYNSGVGAVWVFTSTGSGQYSQMTIVQPSVYSGVPNVGWSLAMSADGTVLAAGGPGQNNNTGGVFIFTQSSPTTFAQFTVPTTPLLPAVYSAGDRWGYSVGITPDSRFVCTGSPNHSTKIGEMGIFDYTSGSWHTYVTFVPGDHTGASQTGASCALAMTSSGTYLYFGGPADNSGAGATWAFFDATALPLSSNCTVPASSAAYNYASCPATLFNGTTCTPTCQPNYVPVGTLTVICNTRVLVPTGGGGSCLYPCTPPSSTSSISYSPCASPTLSGQVCNAQCQSGYGLTSGSLQITCTNGTFSATTGVCTPLPCVVPADTASTIYSTQCVSPVASGTGCTPVCANGYTPSNTLGISCTLGSWSTPAGTCQPNPCARPADTVSTVYAQASCPSPTPSGSYCTPSCQIGYNNTLGSIALLCTLGNYSNPAASCLPNPCVVPTNTASTIYSTACGSSVTSGSSCTPTCQNGYTASASLTVTCQAGSFSAAAGTCQPNPCPRPADTASTLYSQLSCPSSTASGSQCTPTCQSGYNNTGGLSLSLTCSLGNFSAPLGVCVPNPCPQPVDTSSTTYASCAASTPSGGICAPSCLPGFAASASLNLTCQQGIFSTPVGVCNPLPCPLPVVSFPNTTGSCAATTASGTSCNLGCSVGYVANGSLTITCTQGQFSSPLGLCVVAIGGKCSQPTPLAPLTPGNCPLSSNSNTTCTLGCSAGYLPSGSGQFNVTCLNGNFSAVSGTAVCIENPCPLPSFPAGMIQGSCLSSQPGGTSCSFGCAAGYTQSGLLNVTCAGGVFSSAVGSCQPNPCRQVDIPLSAGATAGNCPALIPSGTSCNVACATGFSAVSGSENVTCSLGTFTTTPTVSCVSNPCPLPTFPTGMAQGSCVNFQTGGTSCAFACLPGYTVSAGGALNVTCSSGTFSTPTGVCNPSPCPQPVLPPSSGLSVGSCPGSTSSGVSCTLQCLPGFTGFGSLSVTCTAGTFTRDGPGYCIAVSSVASSASAASPLLVSNGTDLVITLNTGDAEPNATVAAIVVGGTATSSPAAPTTVPGLDASLNGQIVSLAIYISIPSLSLVQQPLTAYNSNAGLTALVYLGAPSLTSACPSEVQVDLVTVVSVRAVGVYTGAANSSSPPSSSSTVRCIVLNNNNGHTYSSVPTALTTTSVTCPILYRNTSDSGQTVSLYVSNDGSLSSVLAQQTPLSLQLQSGCDVSKPGSIASENATICLCPAGSYDTSSSCSPCPLGTYQPTTGQQSSCISCPDNMDTGLLGNGAPRTGVTQESVCICKAGYFPNPNYNPRVQTSPQGGGNSICIPCLTGMQCLGNGTINIIPGYWQPSPDSIYVSSCPNAAACNGTTANSSVGCAIGYQGPLCEVCASSFAKIGQICQPCPTHGINGFVLFLLVFLAIFLAYLLVRTSTGDSSEGLDAQERKAADKAQTGTFFKIFLNYLQSLYYIGRQDANNVSKLAQSFFGVIGQATLTPNFPSVQCAAGWNFYTRLDFVFVSPVIVVLVLAVTYTGYYLLVAVRRSISAKFVIQDFQTAVMVLLYQIHPTIMIEVVAALPCTSVPGTGTSYLKADMSVNCDSALYRRYAAVAILYVIFYVLGAFAALMFFGLWRNAENQDLFIPSSSAYHKYFFFFRGYRKQMYFWEGLILLRKLSIAAISTVAAPMLQLVWSAVVVVFGLNTTLVYQPFDTRFANLMEAAALVSLCACIIIGFYFLQHDSLAAAVFLIIINGGMGLFLFSLSFYKLKPVIMEVVTPVLLFFGLADDNITFHKVTAKQKNVAMSSIPSTPRAITESNSLDSYDLN